SPAGAGRGAGAGPDEVAPLVDDVSAGSAASPGRAAGSVVMPEPPRGRAAGQQPSWWRTSAAAARPARWACGPPRRRAPASAARGGGGPGLGRGGPGQPVHGPPGGAADAPVGERRRHLVGGGRGRHAGTSSMSPRYAWRTSGLASTVAVGPLAIIEPKSRT